MTGQQQSAWNDYGGSGPEIYERYMVPSLFGPWAVDLVKLAAPVRGESVLDVACGTGIVARLAAQHSGPMGKVVGLDLNPSMLTVARSASAGTESIEWREGNAMALPFSDKTFDLVLCQQGLQFFPDRLASSKEMHRVLVPGGRLALSVWTSISNCPGFQSLTEALANHIGSEAAAFMRSPFSLASESELRSLVERAGFHNVKIHTAFKGLFFPSPDEFVKRYVAASPLGPMVARAESRSQQALLEDVSEALQSCVNDDGLTFPIETHFVLAKT
ncbi:MAG TPA: class I SAM-dependent methyltransferase [Candidatus Bathyarchaeia archaeon]|nr:class I SAM-dependent methyltransferase [Candidatus Bathyarchaeia archaeon]